MSSRLNLQAEAISKTFGTRRHEHKAVSQVDLLLDTTSRVGVVGESGSGKTTLGRMLVGLESPSSGRIYVDGQPLNQVMRSLPARQRFRRSVQYVGQDTLSSFDPTKSLIHSVMAPLRVLQHLSRSEASQQAAAMIESLGVDPQLGSRRPHQVSGGQRQRMAIARALVLQPRMLICDEVVSALDVSVQGAVLNLLKDYCDEHDCGLVFIAHSLAATGFISHEIAVMNSGQIVEQGPVEQVFTDPKDAYTRQLIQAHQHTTVEH